MRKIKPFIFSFIFLLCSFVPCFSSYAAGDSWTMEQKVRYVGNAFYKILTDISGVLIPSGLNGEDLQRDWQAYVMNSDVIQNNMTYDEWIASEIDVTFQNGSSGNADITFSPTFQNTVNNFAHDWIEENTGFIYGFSSQSSDYLTLFSSQIQYNAFRDLLNQNQGKLILTYNSSSSFGSAVYICDTPTDYSFVLKNLYNSIYYNVSFYKDWSLFDSSNATFVRYVWDSNNSRYNQFTSAVSTSGILLSSQSDLLSTSANSTVPFFIENRRNQYIIYKSLTALQNGSVGVQEYYVTDSYNTNTDNSINTSYTTTTNSIDNSITYGDVQNFVNNYYVENNEYPNTTITYQYITNYVPSDNGGGSGDDGGGNGSDFDWSFLGTIGDFLAGLLQGLGNALSGILSLLTDIIDMFIGEDGLPNTISQLLGYFLNDFLPPEFLQLIELSIVLMVIVGVIKIIRG